MLNKMHLILMHVCLAESLPGFALIKQVEVLGMDESAPSACKQVAQSSPTA